LSYLAYRIATAAVTMHCEQTSPRFSALSGFLLGVANPKAYLAFISLLASRALVEGSHRSDVLVKWLLCLAVIIVVDLAWLFAGAQLRRLRMTCGAERILNRSLGATVLLAAMVMCLH
jgi:threonine/homoserine/homoserine lactone efflux protein